MEVGDPGQARHPPSKTSGVPADEDLFNGGKEPCLRGGQDAHGRQAGFMHYCMTTSNHRPYDFPAGHIDMPSGSGREGAVKYTDWAIGHFIDEAKAHPWFRDTLFVITADHGANARGTSQIPVDKTASPFCSTPPPICPLGA